MIEFVEAVPLARILAEHRTITAFLNEHNPDGPGAFPIASPARFPATHGLCCDMTASFHIAIGA